VKARKEVWTVWFLDVRGSAAAGYSVSDLRPLGEVKFSGAADEMTIWQALNRAGMASGPLEQADFIVFEENFMAIAAKDGRPMLQLTREAVAP
jgi:hypothetical protein